MVSDDGSGFDTEKIIPLGVGHYGLTGMRERAERIGGNLTLKSELGGGRNCWLRFLFRHSWRVKITVSRRNTETDEIKKRSRRTSGRM